MSASDELKRERCKKDTKEEPITYSNNELQGTNLTKAKRLESFFFEDFCLKARFGISRSRGQTHFKNSGILPICFWDVLGLCLAEFKSHVSSSVDDWIRTVPG